MTISLLAATFLFTACGEKTDETTAKAVESTKAAAQDIAHATKEAASKAMEEASAGAKTAADKVVEASKDVADKATVEAKKAVEKTEDALNAATDSLSNAAGKEAYAKCSGCHGVDGKTKALGKSPEIAGVDKATLVTMLNGYKAGTLNKAGMGTLMKGQVASMDDATIEAVASYISTLK